MFKLFKKLKSYEWILILVSAGFIVLDVWLNLKIPGYMNEITKLIQTPGSQMSEIWKNGGFMLLCAFSSLIGSVIVSFISSKISSALAYRIRENVYNKVQSFSMEEIKNFSTSSLITRTTNDVTQVQMVFVMGIQLLIQAPVTAIWAICKIVGKGWQWSLATAVAVLIMIIVLGIIIIFAVPKFKKIQKLTDDLNRVTRENLTGVRVVRAYNAEQYQEEKFKKANSELTKTHLFTGKIMAIMNPAMTLVLNGLSLSIYWIGALLISNASPANKLNVFSDMVVYSSYAMQVVSAFMMLVFIFMLIPRASVSAKRINEILDTQPHILDGEGVKNTDIIGEVEFKNVSFKYPDAKEYILKNINFKANKGETIAFIGSTGSGKSTLINLIPRFYDATEGEIFIDGVEIKNYKQEELHNKIGYIPQRAVIFSGDIESNLLFGENGKEKINDDKINQALSISQAKEFVDGLTEGLKSNVAQGGTNLSGGQKQRLAIARAIARDPEILIFDDSFSALDYKTDRILRKQLKEKIKGVTTFIVAQRIGTIKNADKIIVLENGNVVGSGKHEELLENCSVYKEIALSQLSKEEL